MTPATGPSLPAPQHLLVCVDVHDDDSCALAHGLVARAASLARALGAGITLLSVVPPLSTPAMPPVGGESAAYRALLERAQLQSAAWRRIVATLTEGLRDQGLTVIESRVLESDAPASQVIVDAAVEFAADLIVLGSHSRHGIARALLGSVAERTAAHASVPVMIVPRVSLRPAP